MWLCKFCASLVESKSNRAMSRPSSRATRLIQTIVLLAVAGLTTTAFATDGCEVLMCLASPTGWTGIAQCTAPMKQVLKDMAFGVPLPSCSVAGSATTHTGSYALAMPANYYNQCPSGSTALPLGSQAVMSPTSIPTNNTAAWEQQQTLYSGIGDGTELAPTTGPTVGTMPPEVCVFGAPIGQVNYPLTAGSLIGIAGSSMLVPVYSTVTLLQANASPHVIGVWIDGALYNQVHW
jgi:hypothetical protein